MNQSYETPSAELFTNLKWMTLDERFEFNRVMMIYKCLHIIVHHPTSKQIWSILVKFMTILQDKQLVANYLFQNSVQPHCFFYKWLE